MDVRRGEQERNWFRSDRFTTINGQWFFQTREGTFEGPFDSVNEAQMELMLFLRHSEDDIFRNAI
ncbi:hypothetical protein MARLIPOL_15302 [Marinobacter lipolyticus SM19]|uniref:DUF6316 domain-containing protein n=1 Tax=Marinobacter lipolyticus SM19 TaxID=1318628 RepID=R8AXW7_9GAMM|nr:DUF6316 family protein [Marinobacter lipolyticus]EON91174.1 hypothetical protein MARLIPOL_15302 [Marinobacter lipolyticus SM19]MCG2582454.1 DUF6316 family protein [Marinobacter sp.]